MAEKEWKKHIVHEGAKTLTAVAGDFTGDGKVDIMTFISNKVILFKAPDWEEVVVSQEEEKNAIHSECFDIDGDGDLDYLAANAWGAPFWLENTQDFLKPWPRRIIDPDVTGIHCLLKADVNNDGKMDIIINNFSPEKGIKNSVGWWSVPVDYKTAKQWDRHLFADGDAAGGSHYFGFGDIDGDGWGEISVAAKGGKFEYGNWFAYWKNPGADKVKEAWEKVVIDEGRNGATNILIGDVNGDSRSDFFVSQGHGVGVFWYDGETNEKTVVDAEVESPHSLVLADLDNDGDLDGATCAFGSSRLSVYTNDGKGAYTRIDVDTDQKSYDLRAVDMDSDGDLDLLNAGQRSENIVWYENLAE